MKISTRDKLLFLEAFLLLGLFRITILLVPFSKLKRYIGTYNNESPKEIEEGWYSIIIRVSRFVGWASRYTPWASKCLVQALTAQNMLKRRKIYSTLYLGISKDRNNKLSAHAWLRSGQVYVTGGIGQEKFTQVAKFSNTIGDTNRTK